MPGMDGVELLARVRERNPDTVRMLLTGHVDLESAIEAVNQGYIFRLLTKPCPADVLEKALTAGLEQYRLVRAGRELEGLRRLKQAMEGVIAGFSTLVERRDPYTAGHQRRVTRLACAMAEALGLEEERVDALRMAGMVHDIGKLYVPSDFLNKPGTLSPEEFSVIKHHPATGADVLQSVDFQWPISSIVRQHHERVDGSGYPDGLAGEDIVPEARILAVADVVDAMSSHRPYRPSLGMDAALQAVLDGRGTLFEPRSVDVCLRLIRDQGFRLDEDDAGEPSASP
jgi:putative nucleotidyltransferase with HDIG domain